MTKLLRTDYSQTPELIVRGRDEADDVVHRLMKPDSLDAPWPAELTIEVLSLFPPPDYIHSYPFDFVSAKLKEVMEAGGAHADFYPASMMYRRRPYTDRRYYACHIRDHIDGFDMERGDYVFEESPEFADHVDEIHVLAIDERKAAGHAMFRLSRGGELYIVASDALAAAIGDAGLTGLYFLDLPSDEIGVMGSAHVSSDESSLDEKIERVMTSLHGPLTDFEIVEEGDAPFRICATFNGMDAKAVFTNGSSDCDLYLPDGRFINTDVKLLLPGEWPVTEASLNDPQYGWPMHWMRKIIREAHDAFDYDYPPQWPDDLAAIFMNGDPPQPLAPNTKLCGWLCIQQEEARYEAPPTYWFDIRLMTPIYEEERQLIESQDVYAFLDRLQERGIPLVIDPDRPNVALSQD